MHSRTWAKSHDGRGAKVSGGDLQLWAGVEQVFEVAGCHWPADQVARGCVAVEVRDVVPLLVGFRFLACALYLLSSR